MNCPASSRKKPYIGFEIKREIGNDIVTVESLTKAVEGEVILKNVNFALKKGDKVALMGRNDVAKTQLLEILAQEASPDQGQVNWGITTQISYFPTDNSKHFSGDEETLVDWLRPHSTEKDETFLRGFLGKMLFSGTDAMKSPRVLSGGEKVRCLFAKMMLSGANVLIFDGPTSHLDLESIEAVK